MAHLKSVAESFLLDRQNQGLLRVEAPNFENSRLCLASNDYLGLSQDASMIHAVQCAARDFGVGSQASRLVYSPHSLTARLNNVLKDFVPADFGSLLFSSGFAANLSFFDILSVYLGSVEIYLDHFAHSSLISGAKRSGLPVYYFKHLDHHALSKKIAKSRAKIKVIVTESLHSMECDFESAVALAAVCRMNPGTFVYIDEAHTAGLYENIFWSLTHPNKQHLAPHLIGIMGGCGKALGSDGALVILPDFLCRVAYQKARQLVYSTGPSPIALASVISALEILSSQNAAALRAKHQEVVASCVEICQSLLPQAQHCAGLISLGYSRDESGFLSPIFNFFSTNIEMLEKLNHELRLRSYIVAFIRPPTVPKGTTRLRLTITLNIDLEKFRDFVSFVAEFVSAWSRQPSE